MAEFSNPTENRPRWFWRFTLLAVTLALAAGAFLWGNDSITVIQTRVEGQKPAFSGIRWLLIGLVAGFWPAIVNKLHQSGRVAVAEKNQLLALRWRVLIWLVLLELGVGQNLLGRFFQAILGVGV